MSELKRYDLECGDGGMYKDYDPKGRWVEADDALENIAAMRQELLQARTDFDVQCLRADTAEVELLKFDEGIRALACSLGAGGYNAEILTADQLVGKVQWGIDNLLEVNARSIAAAEQRIAKLSKAAEEFMEYAESGWDHFPDVGVNLRAALNQKSEGY